MNVHTGDVLQPYTVGSRAELRTGSKSWKESGLEDLILVKILVRLIARLPPPVRPGILRPLSRGLLSAGQCRGRHVRI